jgi:arylsulfatase A-like enzyme
MRLFKTRLPGLGLALALGIAFLLVSYSRLVGDTMSAAFSNVVHQSAFSGSLWGTTLGKNLAVFATTLVLLHLLLAVGCWVLASLSAFAFPRANVTRGQWVFIWCLLCMATILIANATLYPNSSLGHPYAKPMQARWGGIDALIIACTITGLSIGSTLVIAATKWARARQRFPMRHALGALATLAIATAAAVPASRGGFAAPTNKPHVIVVGIDSLRYDETQPDGPSKAVNVGKFLASSTSFDNTVTPLARTFPSWVSILSGRNPHTTGAIINLLPRELIHTGETLGDLFRRAGYRTVYSIDEVRFSNIDASYGFDETITPPIGASEFIIGWFADTPLSNLIVNTRLGAVLFPHVHANRGAAKLYDPHVFLRRLDQRLDFESPTFLAVHLTLAHWPFIWRDAPDVRGVIARRRESVAEADRQFAALMSLLERRGALQNALVVVLSDHGESLARGEDTLVLESQDIGELFERHKKPEGHGTDVLAPKQYQVVFGFRCYGTCPIKARTPTVIDSPASLEDLAPTLNELFSLGAREPFDGRSLRPLLEAEASAADAFRNRVRFTESEFNPVGLMQSGNVSLDAATAAARFYTVDPETDRVEVRKTRLKEILAEREYAAFDSEMLLAALPHEATQYRLLAVRLDRSEARRLTAIPSATHYPDLVPLYSALAHRYGFILDTPPTGDVD